MAKTKEAKVYRELDVDGIKHYVEVHGEGPPLLLLTGMANTMEWWRPALQYLQHHFTCVAYDYASCGRSGKDTEYSIPHFANQAVNLMSVLGFERFNVYGLSMGGMVAQELLIAHPHRIIKAAVISSAPAYIEDNVRNNPEDDPLVREQRESKTRREYHEKVSPYIFSEWFMKNESVAYNHFMDLHQQYVPQADAPAGHLHAVFEHDRRSELQQVTIPTLVIVSGNDLICPAKEQRELAELIPASLIFEVPHASHALVYEDAALHTRVATAFFQGELDYVGWSSSEKACHVQEG